jgi:hypothetical protein
MYTKFNRIVKGFAVSFALVFGLMIVSSTTANAQNRGYYGNDPYYQGDRYNGRDRRGNQSVRFAYQRGYRDGYREGIQAARYGGGRYDNYGRYNNGYGNYGYNNGYGNNGYGNSAWRQAYQNGFNRGYRDGLNRNRGRRNSGYTIRLPF